MSTVTSVSAPSSRSVTSNSVKTTNDVHVDIANLKVKCFKKNAQLNKKIATIFAREGFKPPALYDSGTPIGAMCVYALPYQKSAGCNGKNSSEVFSVNALSMEHIDGIVGKKTHLSREALIKDVLLWLKLGNSALAISNVGAAKSHDQILSTAIPCKFERENAHEKYVQFESTEAYSIELQTPDKVTMLVGINRDTQTVLVKLQNTENTRLIIFNTACRIVKRICESPNQKEYNTEWESKIDSDVNRAIEESIKTNLQNMFEKVTSLYPSIEYTSIERGNPSKIQLTNANQIIIDEYKWFASQFSRSVFQLNYAYASLISITTALFRTRADGTRQYSWQSLTEAMDQWIQNQGNAKSKNEYITLKYKVAIAAIVFNAVLNKSNELVADKFKALLDKLYSETTTNYDPIGRPYDARRSAIARPLNFSFETTDYKLLRYLLDNTPKYGISTPKEPVDNNETHRFEITPAENAYSQTWNGTYVGTSLKAMSRTFRRLFIEDFDEIFKETDYDAAQENPNYTKALKKGAISVHIDTTQLLEMQVQLPYQQLYGVK